MIYYKTFGKQGNKALVLGSSLGTSSNMWNNIIDDLAKNFFVVAFDTRGHGQSQNLGLESSSVEQFAEDVIEVVDHLNIDKFTYAGLSLGGAIGQMLAIKHPERVERLILCCTAPKFGEPAFWHDRANKVLEGGLDSILEATKSRWYNPGTAETNPFAQSLLDELMTFNPVGYANTCKAVADFDVRAKLSEIKCPTLAIAGTEDLSTPVSVMQELANAIPNAELIAVKGAAHIGNVEQPEEFKNAILNFA
ncbi:3-oxoadipate enol-lactonase [Acinetobacter sp. ANC 5414]|uniref:3-oxoadipate enol-lactonase n=1 Tax=Acinetobacter sp. ANC 5414 TaxID=2731251 RepID=UPI00148FB657|nr:3-oxoadipate enol-lactonase [Acinetobacter sp. ANC 5414]NNH01878.1 3-oxoadipate enol-lactonase [Acinetobacter sp. ANC 5414]